MDLLELHETRHLRREAAAAQLHALADALARNNAVEFDRAGRRVTVSVPDEVGSPVSRHDGDPTQSDYARETAGVFGGSAG